MFSKTFIFLFHFIVVVNHNEKSLVTGYQMLFLQTTLAMIKKPRWATRPSGRSNMLTTTCLSFLPIQRFNPPHARTTPSDSWMMAHTMFVKQAALLWLIRVSLCVWSEKPNTTCAQPNPCSLLFNPQVRRFCYTCIYFVLFPFFWKQVFIFERKFEKLWKYVKIWLK